VSGFSRTQTNQSPYLRGPILAGPVDVGTSQSHRLWRQPQYRVLSRRARYV